MQSKPIKPKKCRICRETFTPFRPLQVCCTSGCAIELAQKTRAKKERKELKEAKERIKSRGDWTREAQQAFNAYIRERDRDLPCISCGRMHNGQYHAGHYRTVGANPELRFNELNVHKQCAPCNDHLHGNLINYRINLIKKIGIEAVEYLEGPHDPKKYTIEELKAIKKKYSALARQQKAGTSPA